MTYFSFLTCGQIDILIRPPISSCNNIGLCVCVYVCMYVRACVHACVCRQTRALVCAMFEWYKGADSPVMLCVCVCVHACMRACVRACVCACVRVLHLVLSLPVCNYLWFSCSGNVYSFELSVSVSDSQAWNSSLVAEVLVQGHAVCEHSQFTVRRLSNTRAEVVITSFGYFLNQSRYQWLWECVMLTLYDREDYIA